MAPDTITTSIPSAEPDSSPIKGSFNLAMLVQLAKLRLSLLVVFSGIIAFALGREGVATLAEWVLFFVAGLFTTISANIVNQILERGPDALMDRTRNRPIPTGKLEAPQAWMLVGGFGIIGLGIYLVFLTPLSFFLALASWGLYGFVAFLPYYLKNSFYNILDLFAKNFFGIFLSYIIISGNY